MDTLFHLLVASAVAIILICYLKRGGVPNNCSSRQKPKHHEERKQKKKTRREQKARPASTRVASGKEAATVHGHVDTKVDPKASDILDEGTMKKKGVGKRGRKKKSGGAAPIVPPREEDHHVGASSTAEALSARPVDNAAKCSEEADGRWHIVKARRHLRPTVPGRDSSNPGDDDMRTSSSTPSPRVPVPVLASSSSLSPPAGASWSKNREAGDNGAVDQPLTRRKLGKRELNLQTHVSAIIGKNGETINSIVEKSGGAKVKVEDKGSLCGLNGTDEQVAAAEALIVEIMEQEQAAIDVKVEAVVHVPDSKVHLVIGKAGVVVKKVVAESGAKVTRVPEKELFVLSGLPEQVSKAEGLIELYMSGGPPPEAREDVELGSERGRFVVLGPKGATIRAIQEKSGAKVRLEHEKSYVVVEGDAGAVSAAVAQLQDLLEEHSFTKKMSTRGIGGSGRDSCIPAIIGRGGSTIKIIRETSGAFVELLSGEDLVKVRKGLGYEH